MATTERHALERLARYLLSRGAVRTAESIRTYIDESDHQGFEVSIEDWETYEEVLQGDSDAYWDLRKEGEL